MAATRFNHRISQEVRAEVFHRAGGHCQRCGTEIDARRFHAAHRRAASHGGPPVASNLEAWCPPCNIKNRDRDVSDTRATLREWQKDALPIVLEAISLRGYATVMAAPGAGKTIFAGEIFAAGQRAGLWQRLLVVVPRAALVEQWKRALQEACHIALDTHGFSRRGGLEYDRMDGLCVTYQGLLNPDAQRRHLASIQRTPTLVVLDEVHHLGRRIGDEGARAAARSEAIQVVAGDINDMLHAAGVLNLSGTLFRTAPDEAISTVAYTPTEGDQGEPRIQANTDYAIHPNRLVREGHLRAPDLFRMGAHVEIMNHATSEVMSSPIADLAEPAKREALRGLNWQSDWVEQLVTVTLNELESRHRASNGKPVKALIVAHRQEAAKDFAEEVNRQMRARRRVPLAECVVSEFGADAYRTLEKFRKQPRVGVLCTVGMAGEGFDCPDIAVVTYATNVQTAQYIRQVVARGQRVTDWERSSGMRLTTAIVVPDVPDLVQEFINILAPMIHDIEVPRGETPRETNDREGTGERSPGWHEFELLSARDTALDIVSTIDATGSFDVSPEAKDLLMPLLDASGLPEYLWPRVAHFTSLLQASQPFQPTIELPTAQSRHAEPTQREMTPREQHDHYRGQLAHASRWWAHVAMKEGGDAVQFFIADVYKQAGIAQLERATPEQLKRALTAAHTRIRTFCGAHNLNVPRFAR